jgi:hypothetical protein
MIRTYRESAQTWYLLSLSIEILLETRERIPQEERKFQYTNALNSSLIINSAAMIEGAISSLLINHISNSDNYKTANKKTIP